MKKILSVILLLCMVWSCFVFTAAADDAADTEENPLEDHAATRGVDLVIVLDKTNSMHKGENGKEPSDIHDYRLDAAAMLIGMLDMNGSRVAVVPFARQVEDDSVTLELLNLTDVSDPKARESIVSKIYTLGTSDDTNTGSALIKALQILDARGDSENDPMIVLLTDGINDLSQNKETQWEYIAEPYRVIDGEIKREKANGASQWTAKIADEVTKEATDYAAKRGYPIYTVALNTDRYYSQNGGYSLYEISSKTGVDTSKGSFELNADKAGELPDRFAHILADRIGSSVQMSMKPEYDQEKGHYKVLIPIVNESIKETNVVIMIKPLNSDEDKNNVINPDTIRIEANGEEIPRGIGDSWDILAPGQRTVNNKKVSGHYVMIKIRPNGRSGKWELTFDATEEVKSEDFKFNILYNYDIKLDATLETLPQKDDFNKNDTLHVEAFFRKADASGTRPDDPNLYADHSEDYKDSGYSEDVYNIKGEYKIYRWDVSAKATTGPVLIESDKEKGMQRSTDCFYDNIDLSADGMPRLKEGDYAIVITAKGAGLDRTCTIPFHIKNREPEVITAVKNSDNTYTVSKPIVVNYSDDIDGDSWTVLGTSGTLDVKASDLVKDADAPTDKLNFYKVEPDGDEADQAATISLDPNDNDTIIFTTKEEKLEDGSKRVRSGTAQYWLYYDDGDGTVSKDSGQRVKISLTVASDIDKVLKDYTPVLKIYDEDGHEIINDPAVFLKRKPVTIKLGLCKKDSDGNPTDEYNLEQLEKLSPTVTVKNGLETVEFAGDEPEKDGDFLIYHIDTTRNESATWTVTATVNAYDPLMKTVSIPNTAAPEAVSKSTADIELYWGRNWKLPFVGDLMFHDNTLEEGKEIPVTAEGILTDKAKDVKPGEEALIFTVDESMFTDADNDELTYSAPEFFDKDNNKIESEKIRVEKIEEGQNGAGKYKIIYSAEDTGFFFDWSFNAEMRITATDGDGKTAVYTQKFTVTNVRNQEKLVNLAVLAFVIILVILILSIHQARKPKFPTLNLTIREEPSLFTTGSETLSPVKTPTNVNAMGVDGDMAARHNISMEMLQNIVVKPIRSQSAVGVVCKKAFGGHEVTLEDVNLKPKKQYTWRLEEELVIRNINGEGMIAIKLEDRRGESDDGDIPGGLDFGTGDDWVDSNAGFTDNTYSGGKHTRRVKKKAAQVDEDQSFNNNSDGFDF